MPTIASAPAEHVIDARTPLRQRLSLAGDWRFAPDANQVGLAAGWPRHGLPAGAGRAPVPGVWDTALPGYGGVAFYETEFVAIRRPRTTSRLVFGGSNYLTTAWLNGRELGRHEGGYTPFALACDHALQEGENRLVVRIVDVPCDEEIDGLRAPEIPRSKECWYGGYGGPWGGVWLEQTASARIADVFVRPDPRLSGAIVDVEIARASTETAGVVVRVEIADPTGQVAGRTDQRVPVDEAGGAVRFQIPIARPLLWSPERPALYGWSVDVQTPGGDRDVALGQLGLRSVALDDGRFYVNGHERLLKGVVLQPAYPGTRVMPTTDAMVQRDVELIVGAGFNLVRCHLRPPAPGFLERADRAGLMAYVETPLGWIRPSPHLLERGRRELGAMVRRDRGHPSVVVWGLFNENQAAARAVGDQLLAELARLDPTRPAIDDSGGVAIGEAGCWRWSGVTRAWAPGWEAPRTLNDLHVYLASPPRAEAREALETLGSRRVVRLSPGASRPAGGSATLGPGAVLVSEFGAGGLPDFDAAIAGFAGADDSDAALVRVMRDDLAEGLRARGLDVELGGPQAVVVAAQTIQARGITGQIAALRRNSRVAGYILTQLADAGWEQMAGIVGLWRDPRPAYTATGRANRPWLLSLRPTYHSGFAGRRLRVGLWLSPEPGTTQPTGPAVARMSIEPGEHPGAMRRWCVEARSGLLVAAILRLPSEPGRYVLRATFELGSTRLEAEQPLLVLPAGDRAGPAPLPALGRWSGVAAPGLRQWTGGWEPVLLVDGASGADELAQAQVLARRGAHVVLLGLDPSSAEVVSRVFDLPIAVHGARGNFMGSFHYLRRHALFATLPVPTLADEPFANVVPPWALAELPGAEIVAGCFAMPDGGSRFRWGATVQTLPYGAGRLTLYQLLARPSRRGDPLARRLWWNLVAWLSAERTRRAPDA